MWPIDGIVVIDGAAEAQRGAADHAVEEMGGAGGDGAFRRQLQGSRHNQPRFLLFVGCDVVLTRWRIVGNGRRRACRVTIVATGATEREREGGASPARWVRGVEDNSIILMGTGLVSEWKRA